jgi:hypothetical protein
MIASSRRLYIASSLAPPRRLDSRRRRGFSFSNLKTLTMDSLASTMTDTWEFVDHQAQFQTARFQIRVNPHDPGEGATLVCGSPGPSSPTAQLFRLQLPRRTVVEPVADVYVRQQDLVVTYAQQAARSVSPQIYWRRLLSRSTEFLGLEYVLSMQTDRLASQPQCFVSSLFHFPASSYIAALPDMETSPWPPTHEIAGEPGKLGPSHCRPCVLLRPADADWSYVEMLYPGDFTQCQITSDNDLPVLIQWSLFAESLEKGVIRRARLRSFCIPRQRDERLVEELWGEFLRSPLPLTT